MVCFRSLPKKKYLYGFISIVFTLTYHLSPTTIGLNSRIMETVKITFRKLDYYEYVMNAHDEIGMGRFCVQANVLYVVELKQ